LLVELTTVVPIAEPDANACTRVLTQSATNNVASERKAMSIGPFKACCPLPAVPLQLPATVIAGLIIVAKKN
jgi:hypothetical protein